MPPGEERDFAGLRIIRPLELGDRASVWAAEDPGSGALVAIETLAGEASRDEDVTEWFAEAWGLVAGIEHRAVVAVVSLGEQDGVPFAVRSPAGELTLAERLERGGPLSAGAALQVLTEIGGALETAHEAGVVHGALGPGCVVLDEHGRAHLAGFGRREGDRREDVRALGSLLEAMVGEPWLPVVDAAGPNETTADPDETAVEPEGAAADRADGAPDPAEGAARTGDAAPDEGGSVRPTEPDAITAAEPSRRELARAAALREVGRAGAAGSYERAADLVAAARAARPERATVAAVAGAGTTDPALRGRLIAAAALVAIAAAALVTVLLIGGDDDGEAGGATTAASAPTETPPTPAPATGPSRPVPVRGFPVGVATRDGIVYAVTRDGDSLDGFDEATGVRVFGPVDIGGEGSDVSVVGDAVVATEGSKGTLASVDLTAEQPAVTALAAGADPGPVIGADGAIWVIDGDGALLRFPRNPSPGAEPEATDLDATDPNGISFGGGSLWISDGEGSVLRVDPEDPSDQRAFEVGGHPAAVLADDGTVWVADAASGTVIAVDPQGGEPSAFAVGGEPRALAADAEHLWIANADGYVSSIDLATGAIAQIDLSGAAGSPQAIAVGDQVWVAMGAGNTLVAIAAATS